jgi:hypothetical protein
LVQYPAIIRTNEGKLHVTKMTRDGLHR